MPAPFVFALHEKYNTHQPARCLPSYLCRPAFLTELLMDWLTWFNSLAQPIQDVLIGATGDLAGGLVGQAVAALLGETTGRVRRRFTPTPQSQALHRAMARALVEALAAVDAEPEVQAELLGHFASWLERPNVAGELTQVIAPDPKVELDLELLEAEFEAAGFAPELLGHEHDLEAIDFAEVVARFVRNFYDAACQEPELTPAIELQLLRGAVERLETLAQESRRQTRTLVAIEHRLATLARLDLDALEQAYLDGLYRESNRLPLATHDEPPDAVRPRQPRLQRVYVDLYTMQEPSLDDVLARLQIPAAQQGKARGSVYAALQGPRGEPEADVRRNWVVQELRRLNEEGRVTLAETLKVAPDALHRSLTGLTPIDLLRRQTTPQLVLLGNPGSGKSTLTRRLASALAGLARRDLRQTWDEEEAAWGELLVDAFGRTLLPVRVVLSTWAKHLPPDASGCAADLVAECVRLLRETAQADPGRQAEHFERRLLAAPPTALLLLDGLDEVTDERKRSVLLAAVQDFCAHFERVPLLDHLPRTPLYRAAPGRQGPAAAHRLARRTGRGRHRALHRPLARGTDMGGHLQRRGSPRRPTAPGGRPGRRTARRTARDGRHALAPDDDGAHQLFPRPTRQPRRALREVRPTAAVGVGAPAPGRPRPRQRPGRRC